MNIEKSNRLSVDSLLNQDNGIFDFVETYYITIKRNDIGLNEIISSFFKSIPKWFLWMLNFGTRIKTMDGSKPGYSEGDIIGPFHLFRLTDREAILGVNSKYLDYRVSMMIDLDKNQRFCVSIVITVNTLAGKCYFILVKVIHYFFVRRILNYMSSNF